MAKKNFPVYLEDVCIFWTDENGIPWCTAEGAKYLNESEDGVTVHRKGSDKGSEERRPRRHDWRYYKARSKGQKVQS